MEMTVILSVALLVAIVALAVEIGIASWNIRRAGRYKQSRNIAEAKAELLQKRADHTNEKFQLLDKFTTDIAWLVKFLYSRYEKFEDIFQEVDKGIDATGETPINEINKKYTDLVRAARLVKVNIRASEKIDDFMASIATQIHSIIRDLEEDDESETESASETEAPKTEVSTEPPAVEVAKENENSQGNDVQ